MSFFVIFSTFLQCRFETSRRVSVERGGWFCHFLKILSLVVLELHHAGYGRPCPPPGNFYGLKATDLADAGNTTPAEFLFRTYFNSRDLENKHFAPYYLGKANTVPSQNLVDAFPMKTTGYPISDTQNSAYDPENPYDGRDNRFYLNIYYQGAVYGKTGLPVDVVYGGKDSQSYDPFASRSGYYQSPKFKPPIEFAADNILGSIIIWFRLPSL